ncbi:hypothetical protein PC116_g4489 [Phytophthora cactorum]|uniref:RxLR effector protein n=1 Tax=Phytophthora cactorum TaxID=29920 RepID=A0A329SYN5_9STRA|nr:hypothetical protein Pcac1_g14418 [Phytophthora cactorum]KAG2827537.1 hypothetical protein PC111_g8558 [Phytophthora cactorum]KAG2831174.1 hypothetical protein PC112_g7386 [Phytophthora cactorum]KAG2865776.1 hypothetical protein PC113_g3403 [Phytophthora cactorum]KAG2904264.1 hypothetical protein PC114_g11918 [Phytophthora cactorum]
MRATLLLLLVVIALLGCGNPVSGSSNASLRSSHLLLVQSTGATDVGNNNERLLRANVAAPVMSDPEERSAITDLATKLVTGTKAFGKNIKAAWFVKYGSMFNDQQIAMRLFMKHNIDPDLVYRWLNLKKLKNQSNYLHPIETPEMELWRKYKDVWVRHFPGWKSKIVGDL